MKNNARIEWIDAAKGILIVLVVFGHLNASKWFPELDGVLKWIYTFHMAVFFILSGIVFSARKDVKEFLMSKLKTLIIPYAVFSLLALTGVASDFIHTKDLRELIQSTLRIYIMGEGMWFLCALFIVECMAYFLQKSKVSSMVVFVCSTIIGGGYYELCTVNLPLKMDVALYALPIFYFGILLQPYSKKITDISVYKQIIALACGLMLSVTVCYLYYMSKPDITLRIEHVILPWYWISVIVGAIWVIAFALLVTRTRYIKIAVTYLGKNSIVFYCFNDILLKVFKTLFFVVLKIDIKSFGLAGQLGMGLVIVVLTICATIPVNILLSQRLPFLIGRN